jgi:hypothetical protein
VTEPIFLTWMCSSAQTLGTQVKRSRRYQMLKHASRPHGRSSGKIEIMTYAQFQTNVVPTLPQAVAAAIDEATFEELRLKVGERVERWIQDAQAKLKGEEP